jgi:hypothetical protein
MKKGHYFSGIFIAVFVSIHLLNHLISLKGAAAHIQFMEQLRFYYRNGFIESLLLGAVVFQIVSGVRLFRSKFKTASSVWEKIQLLTGLYLALFFTFHLTAIIAGRFLLQLDTNFYFGAAGINTFPFSLFFVPYYGLAILAFFGHIAALHSQKMHSTILYLTPQHQAILLIGIGAWVTILIISGMTNNFNGIDIPEAYGVLVGK